MVAIHLVMMMILGSNLPIFLSHFSTGPPVFQRLEREHRKMPTLLIVCGQCVLVCASVPETKESCSSYRLTHSGDSC